MRAGPWLEPATPDRQGRRFLDRNERDEDTMPKNILVFSDGTGQAGGLTPDENRSNIYKIFRATRCGPDTNIDAARADRFLRRRPRVAAAPWRVLRHARLALAAQRRQPGDRARHHHQHHRLLRLDRAGVRTRRPHLPVRLQPRRLHGQVPCGGASLCGVPTRMPDGTPLRRDVGGSTASPRRR